MAKKRRLNPQSQAKVFGEHLEKLIERKGFASPYEFWIHQAGDSISRSALNYLINGSREPKLSTLILLMNLLDASPKEMFEFIDKK